MQRNLEINSKINNWTVISSSIIKNGSRHYNLQCNCCTKIVLFDSSYINRNTFSKQCRSCSQKERRKNTAKYKLGTKILNLEIIGNPYIYKHNTYYKVKCDCGHIYNTGHSTFSKKNRMPYCSNCFNYNLRKPKRNTMFTEHISKSVFNRLYKQAILRGIEFSLTPEYLEKIFILQNKKCILSGLPLNISPSLSLKTNRENNTASLDRIDSSLGYIEGNIQWVYKTINIMKMDLKQQDFINMCTLIHNLHVNQQPN